MAKLEEVIVPVRFELANYDELRKVYHALGELLMAAESSRAEADRG